MRFWMWAGSHALALNLFEYFTDLPDVVLPDSNSVREPR
jgi:hypothetical protein